MKRKVGYKIIMIGLCAIVFLQFLSRCYRVSSHEPISDNTKTLWVVTEQSTSDGFNLQADKISQWMEENYGNVSVYLDVLPTNAEEREIRLKQLCAQIMAGDGPDVYLLPVGNVLTSDFSKAPAVRGEATVQIEPLFQDVIQAMYTGVFADISGYFDADDQLRKEALKTEIMDAGLLDNARLVLPLRYTMPVILTGTEALTDTNIANIVNHALERADIEMLIGLQIPSNLSLLPQLFDYEKGEILVTASEIADYMRLYQRWTAATFEPSRNLIEEWENMNKQRIDEDYREYEKIDLNIDSFNNIRDYFLHQTYWNTAGLPLFTSCLADTIQSAAISKVAKLELTMYPLSATDGSVVAQVTYYGAVGSSCEDPGLAYAFLRQFLTEEYQWERYRPRIEKSYIVSEKKSNELQNYGLIENSWPVRSAGSVEYLWDNIQYQVDGIYSTFLSGSRQMSKLFQNSDLLLTDDDIPALDFAIEEVRFAIVQESDSSLEYALSLLNDENGNPTDVDIDALAEQVWTDLWWHLAEG